MDHTTEAEMWAQFHATGDREARNWLIDRYTRLARSIACRWPGINRTDREDLAQEAVLALIRCVDTWDPERTTNFASFLVFRVRAAVIDHMRLNGFAKKSTRNLARRIDEAEAELMVRNAGRPPTAEQMVVHLGLEDVDALAKLRSTAQGTHWSLMSLDAPVTAESGDDCRLGDMVADPSASVEEAADRREQSAMLWSVLARLPSRHRDILVAVFLLGESQKSVAARYGFHESRTSQLIDDALAMARQLSYEAPLALAEEAPCA